MDRASLRYWLSYHTDSIKLGTDFVSDSVWLQKDILKIIITMSKATKGPWHNDNYEVNVFRLVACTRMNILNIST